jgi:hypothetical protein
VHTNASGLPEYTDEALLVPVENGGINGTNVGARANNQEHNNQQGLKIENCRHSVSAIVAKRAACASTH